jgi:hypothetical protein
MATKLNDFLQLIVNPLLDARACKGYSPTSRRTRRTSATA